MNKIIIITGGTSGFGKAMAENFVKDGHTVIVASKDNGKLESTKKEIGCADTYYIDVTDAKRWEEFGEYIKNKYGKVDVLINNAGCGVNIVSTPDQTLEDIDSAIKINLNSVIYGSKIFGGIMREQKYGQIINLSSVCSKHAWEGWSVYAAAKAGVLAFSKGLYRELQKYNVRVSCVIPGGALTNFQKNANTTSNDTMLRAKDIADTVKYIVDLPETAVVEDVTVWGIGQVVDPL